MADSYKSADGRLLVAPADESKVFCQVCKCYVRSEGHETRCRVPTSVPARLKELAWVGDSVWEKHVRIAVLCSGAGVGPITSFVSNEALAVQFASVKGVLNLGDTITSSSSVKNKATYVEAALALSSDVRFVIASAILHAFDSPSLWLRELVVTPSDLRELQVGLQPSFDGYCYLHCVLPLLWTEIGTVLGPYPTWGSVKRVVVYGQGVSVYIGKCGTVAHISTFPKPGLRFYTGPWVDIPFFDNDPVGGLGFGERFLGSEVPGEPGPQMWGTCQRYPKLLVHLCNYELTFGRQCDYPYYRMLRASVVEAHAQGFACFVSTHFEMALLAWSRREPLADCHFSTLVYEVQQSIRRLMLAARTGSLVRHYRDVELRRMVLSLDGW